MSADGAPVRVFPRSPPRVALSAEIRWVLLRAFGPRGAPPPDRVDARRAAALAGDLGLVERIATRVPSALLVAELGSDLAHPLALLRLQTLARLRPLCELIPELASAMAAEAIPIVFLKFAALHAGGYLAEGARSAGDIDVLLPEREIARATRILAGRGFFPSQATLSDHHHSPPLHDRAGRVVELHTRLPGLRAPGARRFAGFEALHAAGGLVPAPGPAGGCYLLRADLIAAHAVVHALAQHGGADAYPITRALADVLDVLPGDRRNQALQAVEWIVADLPSSELHAVLGLCDVLERGDLDALEAAPTPRQAMLLDHVLASALDAGYRRSLAVGQVFQALSDEPRLLRFVKTVQCRVWPSRAQLAARLGLPSPRVVTWRVWLAEARALAGRVPAAARAAARAAWRRAAQAVRRQ